MITQACALAAAMAMIATPLQAQFTPLRADGNGIEALRTQVVVSLSKVTVARAISAVAEQAHLNITFDPSLPGLEEHTSVTADKLTAAAVLLAIVNDRDLAVQVSSSGQLVITRRPRRPTGAIRGEVRDPGGEPLADVRVEVTEARRSSASSATGAYTIGAIPAGAQAVRFSRLGYVPHVIPGVIVSEDDTAVLPTVTLRPAAVPLAAVMVSPGHFGIMEQTNGSGQTMTREQIESNPQLGEDVFRAINRLPGLSANDMSARFYVRGGSLDELYVTLDGVELFEPFHLKDIDAALSLIDVEAIAGIDLNTGGFSSEYGDRLTGVLSMKSLEPRRETRSAVGLSILNLRGMTQGTFNGGRGGWLVSARRGYLDLALALTNSNDSISPRYYDVFGKVQYDLTPNQRVAAHVLRGKDWMRYQAVGDPTIHSQYGSDYGWLSWDGTWNRLRGSTVASLARLTWERSGAEQDNLASPILFLRDMRSARIASLRQDWSYSFADWALLRAGGVVRSAGANYEYDNWLRRRFFGNGEIVERVDTVAATANPDGATYGAYLTQRVSLGPVVTEAGVRYDRQTYGVSADQVSPRVSMAWSPLRRTTVRLGWGKYYQPQPVYELQVHDGVTQFYPAELAEHRVAEIEQQVTPSISIRGELYERRMRNSRPRFANTSNTIQVLPELSDDRVRLDLTDGRAHGVELFLSGSHANGYSWSSSYALARVVDFIGGREVPRSIDQRHTVYLDGAYLAASGKWRVSAGWLFHSGWPYTPTFFRFDTVVTTSQFSIVNATSRIGAVNSGRLPSYKRLDLRATRYFDTRNGRISTFIDLFNTLNAWNPRGYQYDFRQNPFRVERSVDRQIPRLPTAGITWEF
jgi:hypothetical protein